MEAEIAKQKRKEKDSILDELVSIEYNFVYLIIINAVHPEINTSRRLSCIHDARSFNNAIYIEGSHICVTRALVILMIVTHA